MAFGRQEGLSSSCVVACEAGLPPFALAPQVKGLPSLQPLSFRGRLLCTGEASSDWSAAVSSSTPPRPADAVVVTASVTQQVELRWARPSLYDCELQGYEAHDVLPKRRSLG